MTEEEWLTCADSARMLRYLNVNGNARKPLLYATAVCLRQPDILPQHFRVWIELADKVLRGTATTSELHQMHESANRTSRLAGYIAEIGPAETRAQYGGIADVFCTWFPLTRGYDHLASITASEVEAFRLSNANLAREIFGNPFRPVIFDLAWRTETALSLAQQMYDSRDFGAMPILADALQDAGCDNDDILNHCRGDGPHVRGCWVVDLVLVKS